MHHKIMNLLLTFTILMPIGVVEQSIKDEFVELYNQPIPGVYLKFRKILKGLIFLGNILRI